jgi:hypothetical protein
MEGREIAWAVQIIGRLGVSTTASNDCLSSLVDTDSHKNDVIPLSNTSDARHNYLSCWTWLHLGVTGADRNA